MKSILIVKNLLTATGVRKEKDKSSTHQENKENVNRQQNSSDQNVKFDTDEQPLKSGQYYKQLEEGVNQDAGEYDIFKDSKSDLKDRENFYPSIQQDDTLPIQNRLPNKYPNLDQIQSDKFNQSIDKPQGLEKALQSKPEKLEKDVDQPQAKPQQVEDLMDSQEMELQAQPQQEGESDQQQQNKQDDSELTFTKKQAVKQNLPPYLREDYQNSSFKQQCQQTPIKVQQVNQEQISNQRQQKDLNKLSDVQGKEQDQINNQKDSSSIDEIKQHPLTFKNVQSIGQGKVQPIQSNNMSQQSRTDSYLKQSYENLIQLNESKLIENQDSVQDEFQTQNQEAGNILNNTVDSKKSEQTNEHTQSSGEGHKHKDFIDKQINTPVKSPQGQTLKDLSNKLDMGLGRTQYKENTLLQDQEKNAKLSSGQDTSIIKSCESIGDKNGDMEINPQESKHNTAQEQPTIPYHLNKSQLKQDSPKQDRQDHVNGYAFSGNNQTQTEQKYNNKEEYQSHSQDDTIPQDRFFYPQYTGKIVDKNKNRESSNPSTQEGMDKFLKNRIQGLEEEDDNFKPHETLKLNRQSSQELRNPVIEVAQSINLDYKQVNLKQIVQQEAAEEARERQLKIQQYDENDHKNIQDQALGQLDTQEFDVKNSQDESIYNNVQNTLQQSQSQQKRTYKDQNTNMVQDSINSGERQQLNQSRSKKENTHTTPIKSNFQSVVQNQLNMNENKDSNKSPKKFSSNPKLDNQNSHKQDDANVTQYDVDEKEYNDLDYIKGQNKNDKIGQCNNQINQMQDNQKLLQNQTQGQQNSSVFFQPYDNVSCMSGNPKHELSNHQENVNNHVVQNKNQQALKNFHQKTISPQEDVNIPSEDNNLQKSVQASKLQFQNQSSDNQNLNQQNYTQNNQEESQSMQNSKCNIINQNDANHDQSLSKQHQKEENQESTKRLSKVEQQKAILLEKIQAENNTFSPKSKKASQQDNLPTSTPKIFSNYPLEGGNAISTPNYKDIKSTPINGNKFSNIGEKFYDYEQLTNTSQVPSDVDPLRREAFLSDEVFESYFKMNKEKFYTLPGWKQKQQKVALSLF